MLDFEAELEKLLAGEQKPLPQYELTEVLSAGWTLLDSLNKKHADLSLQIEEIYDLTREADPRELREALNAERGRESQLLQTVVGLGDLLEHFCIYARQSGSVELERQASLLWQNSRNLLESSGFTRLGEGGECLDPALHSVQGAAASEFERERVIEVLQSGYSYMGMVLRKAAVIVSKGVNDNIQEEEEEENENEQNSWH
ncbi:MAG: nucleotide exchange factor GrpE [Treponema sp.]|jgi:molecular chaperone GrpE (heat shock protein)|nr:nucleotide exchange factor GrpE [Treponema sp.]